jgi:fucose 4-O-acetylase-like acetyltransferase
MVVKLTDAKNQKGDRKYNYKLGYVRAIAIVAIVLSHTGLGGLSYLPGLSVFFDWFSPYSFMIPVFFFVSGYFYEDTAKLFGYIRRRFSRLVISYYSWNLFYVAVFFVVTSIGLLQWAYPINLNTFFVQPWIYGDQYAFNLAGWFVLCLFLVQVVFVLIRKSFVALKLKNEYCIFAFFFALGLIGTYLVSIGYDNSFYVILDRTLFGLPFVQLGFLYKAKLEKFDKSNIRNMIISMILLVIAQFVLLNVYGALDYDPLHVLFRGRILQPFLSSFTGIWLCLQISTLFLRVFETKTLPSKVLKYIGDNSWSIMINQFLGFWLLSGAFLFFGAPGFNVAAFKTDIYYKYLINGDAHYLILYVAVGIFLPLLLTYCLTKLRAKTKHYFEKRKLTQNLTK